MPAVFPLFFFDSWPREFFFGGGGYLAGVQAASHLPEGRDAFARAPGF